MEQGQQNGTWDVAKRPDVGQEIQISDFVSANGMALEVPVGLQFSVADKLLESLWKTKDLSQFYIGDLLNATENQEYYSQLLDETRYAKKTVDKFKRVSHKVSGRWENLSFDHHESVSALAEGDQNEWLTRTSEMGWTTAQLREELREAGLIARQKKPDKPRFIVCPHCDRWTVDGLDCQGCQNDILITRVDAFRAMLQEVANPSGDLEWVVQLAERALEEI